MTTFKVMAKRRYDKRFHKIWETTTDSKIAERRAVNAANTDIYHHVKVVLTDDNGITNELIYK